MLPKIVSAFIAIQVVVSSALVGCGGDDQPDECAPGNFPVDGVCLDGSTQNYVGCIKGRGQNLTTEDRKKFDLAIDAGLRGGGDGIVELTKKVTEEELPDATLQIIEDCMELSKNRADTPADVRQELDEYLLESFPETISLEPSSGPYEQTISVIGKDWPPNIDVEISAGFAKSRATTDASGAFAGSIQLDERSKSVAGSAITIRVAPVKPSTTLGTSALYSIRP